MSANSFSPSDFFFTEGADRHVHMVGVCGIGMAGLAFLLTRRGFRVTGCDTSRNRLASWLAAAGVEVLAGHSVDHIDGDVAAVVHSAAVRLDAAEIVAARQHGIPLFCRGEVLPALLTKHVSVAVGGTHGKTTTSTFIACVMKDAGLDPAWCIGGEIDVLGGVAGDGAGPIVVEADESDGTLALYAPDVGVVTNVEFDHMEHFEGAAALESCFLAFIRRAVSAVVFCGDDPRARSIAEARPDAISYGLGEGLDLQGVVLVRNGAAISFEVWHHGAALGRIDLPVPGEHNARNALAAVAVGMVMGIDFAVIKRGLERVALPRRRYECVADSHGVRVISDYAHHPTEIAAVMASAREHECRRRLAVFQPHRYTRTRALGPDFPPAFSGLEQLILTPVYAASELPLAGGTVWDLYAEFRRREAAESDACARVAVAESLEQVGQYLRGELQEGDLLLVIGAGDVDRLAGGVARDLCEGTCPEGGARQHLVALAAALPRSQVVADAPLGKRTTLGVGGRADLFVRVGDEADLARLLEFGRRAGLALRVLGGGSNVLVSDLGVRGIVARLTGQPFVAIRREAGVLVAGAGVALSRLLDRFRADGFCGLEFLEGIPGTVGGAVAMNAGAWGKSACEQVSWIRCLNPDGGTCILTQSDLDYGYRCCSSLSRCVVTEVAFKAVRCSSLPCTGSREREDYALKRAWMKGLRSAGSVFRNPAGGFAGKLLEDAGVKGLCVGGARVTCEHANVIAVERGSFASDVRALMALMQSRVRDRFGCDLNPEVHVWM